MHTPRVALFCCRIGKRLDLRRVQPMLTCLTNRSVWAMIAALACCIATKAAVACPDGYYSDSFGICWPYGPKIGGTPGQTWEALKKGDFNTAAKGVGDIVITLKCPACAVAGQLLISRKDRATISTIVGRGVILQAVGLPSAVVYGDIALNVVTSTLLQNPQKTVPIPQASAPARPPQVFKSVDQATCITQKPPALAVVAAWVQAPRLSDAATKQFTYPDLDLQIGDTIEVTAPTCPEYAGIDTKSLVSASFKYEGSQIIPGSPERLKHFLWGTLPK
jgi:hypothetical protein